MADFEAKFNRFGINISKSGRTAVFHRLEPCETKKLKSVIGGRVQKCHQRMNMAVELEKVYRFLKPKQIDAIFAAGEGDVSILFPTGFGKTVIMQVSWFLICY